MFCVSAILFGPGLGVVLALIAGVLVTGGFHEDGLADVADGFGGGWTKTKILEIMKDSRVGAYGVIALIALFAVKYLALVGIPTTVEGRDYLRMAIIFIAYHALARATAISIVFTSQYSREDENSKAKPIARAHGRKEIMGAYAFGLLPLLALSLMAPWSAIVILPLFVLYAYAKRYFEKWIDGYTGDCLGAVEQVAECVCLLTFFAIC